MCGVRVLHETLIEWHLQNVQAGVLMCANNASTVYPSALCQPVHYDCNCYDPDAARAPVRFPRFRMKVVLMKTGRTECVYVCVLD